MPHPSQDWIPIITTEVHKAAIYACEQSLDTLTEAKKEISTKLLTAGKRLVLDEPKFLAKVKAYMDQGLAQRKRDQEERDKVEFDDNNEDLMRDLLDTGFKPGEEEVS